MSQTQQTISVNQELWDELCSTSYIPLSQNPEVLTAVEKIADIIGSMSIHLMQETDKGNIRVVNGLSRKLDVNPCSYMIRKNFISLIVKNLLLTGNAVCIPISKQGLLEDILPLPPYGYAFNGDITGYNVIVSGETFNPKDVLHFIRNPNPNTPWEGQGVKVALKQILGNLDQGRKLEHGLLKNPIPPVIVKVDAYSDDLNTVDGREEIAQQYLERKDKGLPWIVPAELVDVGSVKTQSLTDLAIMESYKINKRTIASMFGVPSFLLGEGKFSSTEWDNFINATVMPICKAIEQELTKKLLYAPDLFFKFNIKVLYSYDPKRTATIMGGLYAKGIVTGNEVRESIGMNPRDGLDELLVLENYIPRDMSGEQKKLNGKEDDSEDDEDDDE